MRTIKKMEKIMSAIAETPDFVCVRDIAVKCDMPKSSVSKYLKALCQVGWLERSTGKRHYSLSKSLPDLMLTARSNLRKQSDRLRMI